MEDLAELAGVSVMTVSRALRNAPGSSAVTRERIQKLAQELGYLRNPYVSAFMEQRRRRHPVATATIGWLNDSSERGYWQKVPYVKRVWEGAVARAEGLGFRLEEIWSEGVRLDTPTENARRLHRQITARGIFGLIIPLGRVAQHALVDWPELAVVTAVAHRHEPEHEGPKPRYHSVLPDTYDNVNVAFLRLHEMGCKRIGFHLPGYLDRVNARAMRAAYLSCQSLLARERRVPLLDADIELGVKKPRQFEDWIRRYEPDAVLCSKNETVGWLQGMGLRVPEDVRVAHLSLAEDVPGWSGIDPCHEQLGATMVETVVSMLQRNERAAPKSPLRILVPGLWRDGWTARA